MQLPLQSSMFHIRPSFGLVDHTELYSIQTDDNNKCRATTLMQKRIRTLLEQPNIKNPEHLETFIRILTKTSRQKLELNFLMKGFQSLNFFKEERAKLSEVSYQSLFKELGYKSFTKEEPIFNYGDFGHTYYIILRGSVSILLPKEDVFIEMQRDKKCEIAQNLLFVQFLHKRIAMNRAQFMHQIRQQVRQRHEVKISLRGTITGSLSSRAVLSDVTDRGDDLQYVLSDAEDECSPLNGKYFEKFVSQIYADFSIIRKLKAGDAFGEIALITESKRTATIICNEDCDVMTLTKDSFDKILGDQLSLQMNEKIKFFQKFEFLKQVPLGKLMSLIHQMSVSRPKLHEVIYRELDASTGVYFLSRGEVEISQSVSLKEAASSAPQQQDSLSHLRLAKQKHKNISVSILTEGASFGYEEMLTNAPRQSRAVSKSNETVVYWISQQSFLGIIYMHSTEKLLKRDTQQIDVQRSQRLQKNIMANQLFSKDQRDFESARRFKEHPQQSTSQVKQHSLFKMVQSVQSQEESKECILQRITQDANQFDLWELLTQNQDIKKDTKHTPSQFSIAAIKHNLDSSKVKTNESLLPTLNKHKSVSPGSYYNSKFVIGGTTSQQLDSLKDVKSFRSVAMLSSFQLLAYENCLGPKVIPTPPEEQQKNIHMQRLAHLHRSKTKKINTLLQAMF